MGCGRWRVLTEILNQNLQKILPHDIMGVTEAAGREGASWIQEDSGRTCHSLIIITGRALPGDLDGNQQAELPGLSPQDAHLRIVSLCMADCSRRHLFILWLSWLLMGPIQRHLCITWPQNQAPLLAEVDAVKDACLAQIPPELKCQGGTFQTFPAYLKPSDPTLQALLFPSFLHFRYESRQRTVT